MAADVLRLNIFTFLTVVLVLAVVLKIRHIANTRTVIGN